MTPNVFAYAGLVSFVSAVLGLPSGLRKYPAASLSTRSCGAASAMAAASRGLMSNPSSASVTAGANRSRHAVLPCVWWTSISSRRMPGTPMERPDALASGLGSVRSVSEIQRR